MIVCVCYIHHFNLNSVWHRIELRICVQNIFNHMATIDLEEFCQSFTFCTYKSYPESGVSSPNVAMGYESNGFDRKFSCVNVKVMSTNGLEYVPFQKNKMIHHSSQSTVLNLGPFDFAVLSCGIICPPCVRNETDFLTMMNKITFQVSIRKGTKYDTKHPFESKSLAPYSATNGAHDALDIETSIPIELFDESTIWDHYLELPGGIVLLRDRPLSSIL